MPFDLPDKPTDETGMEPRGQRATSRPCHQCEEGNHDRCGDNMFTSVECSCECDE